MLAALVRKLAVVHGRVTLSSGAEADFYVDLRRATLHHEAGPLIGAVLLLSFVVITGFVGQISLVQVALAGISAFAVARLTADTVIGFPFAPVVGALVAVLFGVVTAVSALRVRGVNLAIVTLAGAVAIETFGFQNTSWGGGTSGSPVPQPSLLGVDLGTARQPVAAAGVACDDEHRDAQQEEDRGDCRNHCGS